MLENVESSQCLEATVWPVCVKCGGIVCVEEVKDCCTKYCCEMNAHIFLLTMSEAILDLVFEQNGQRWTIGAQLTLQIIRWIESTIEPKLSLRML